MSCNEPIPFPRNLIKNLTIHNFRINFEFEQTRGPERRKSKKNKYNVSVSNGFSWLNMGSNNKMFWRSIRVGGKQEISRLTLKLKHQRTWTTSVLTPWALKAGHVVRMFHDNEYLDLMPRQGLVYMSFCSRSETLNENTKKMINQQLTWLHSTSLKWELYKCFPPKIMESFWRRAFYSPFPLLLAATFISASGGSRDVVSDDGESQCQPNGAFVTTWIRRESTWQLYYKDGYERWWDGCTVTEILVNV